MNRKKLSSEEKFRNGILTTARRLGCEQEIRAIFKKYDDLLRNCTNKEERRQIANLGIVEIHRYFGCRGSLEINGVEVIPAEQIAK